MASIIREFAVAADAEVAWAALEEVGKVNQLITFLGPVTVEGDVRRVDMAENGIIEELIVSVDPALRRMSYSVRQGPWALTHHHSVMQVLPPAEGDSGSRVAWLVDLKPDSLAEEFAAGMEGAVEAMKASLGKATP
ncbi:SRPBCC family protein [Streptomyces sp. NBC_00102]|uniref:SRPBCC family protein n=1 Tax=Streptomyces sp. NBC_00102 TaxID=2975652 RepID=UPI00224E12D5|nr:SRPBCC family protein [Streptomyces sp. NBC_00102]MCX5399878.1 SRPBCC family protein [Streptomyces sp. NBC_00102]